MHQRWISFKLHGTVSVASHPQVGLFLYTSLCSQTCRRRLVRSFFPCLCYYTVILRNSPEPVINRAPHSNPVEILSTNSFFGYAMGYYGQKPCISHHSLCILILPITCCNTKEVFFSSTVDLFSRLLFSFLQPDRLSIANPLFVCCQETRIILVRTTSFFHPVHHTDSSSLHRFSVLSSLHHSAFFATLDTLNLIRQLLTLPP